MFCLPFGHKIAQAAFIPIATTSGRVGLFNVDISEIQSSLSYFKLAAILDILYTFFFEIYIYIYFFHLITVSESALDAVKSFENQLNSKHNYVLYPLDFIQTIVLCNLW